MSEGFMLSSNSNPPDSGVRGSTYASNGAARFDIALRLNQMQLKPIREKLRRSDWSRSAVLGERGVAARDFADIVVGQLVGTVLPWSRREKLIRAASAHGITRFEANLIIATVQHQMGVGRRRDDAKPSRLSVRIATGLAMFVIIQSGIIAAVWYCLF
jgi:hypothetical protein